MSSEDEVDEDTTTGRMDYTPSVFLPDFSLMQTMCLGSLKLTMLAADVGEHCLFQPSVELLTAVSQTQDPLYKCCDFKSC